MTIALSSIDYYSVFSRRILARPIMSTEVERRAI